MAESSAQISVNFLDVAPRVRTVCSVDELFYVEATGIQSGISKAPRSEFTVQNHGGLGDVQGDREHHAGIFKAVYVFASESREAIAKVAGVGELADGIFGENIVTEGIDTDNVVVGTRWRIGAAEIEATVPRPPCRTFIEWMKDVARRNGKDAPRAWGRMFNEYGRCGAYFKVESEGIVRPGDSIEVVRVPDHGVRISDLFGALTSELDPEHAERLLSWARETDTPLYASTVDQCVSALGGTGAALDFPEHLKSDGRGN